MNKAGLESNIWKYAVFLITNKRTYMTILGVYLLTLPGTTPKTIGLMNLIGSAVGFVFEVPSGYLADKMGHKNALVLARVCMLFSSILFLIGSQVWVFILGASFLSIAIAFQSGTTSVFMHETLRGLGRESEYSKIMGRLSSIGFAVPIVFIVGIPFLVAISYKAAFAVAVAIDIVGFLVTLSLVGPQKTKEQIKEIDLHSFKQVVREGQQYGFLKYALFVALMGGVIMGSSYFKDVYQAAVGVPIVYYGIFWAVSRVIVSILLLYNDKVKNAISFHQFLFIKMVIAIMLITLLGVANSAWLVVATFILISSFNWSFKETQNHFMLELISESSFKSTLLSLKALIGIMATGVIGFVVGYLAEKSGYASAFLVSAIAFGVILTALYLYIVLSAKFKAKSKASV